MPYLPPFFITEPIYIIENQPKFPMVVLLPDKLSIQGELFLGKILRAVSLEISQCKLIYPKKTTQAKEVLLSTHLLSFGVDFNQTAINWQIPPYETVKIGETKVIIADALLAISQSVELKKRLWAAMQVFFNN
ncbi:MAG: hypothetical protein NZ551_07755 [Microscillaceae bacterium]|nr:hypothetical protein [Microscillaceae bacterium]MDW8461090.1 hypothetical protein [Cytophagales bacterium]